MDAATAIWLTVALIILLFMAYMVVVIFRRGQKFQNANDRIVASNEQVATNQQRSMDLQERSIDLQERNVMALERIAAALERRRGE